MILQLKRIRKIGLFFLAALILSWFLLELFEKRFDEAEWKSLPTQRYEMVDDLIESQVLHNMSKTEVITLLGEPSSRSTIKNDIFLYKLGTAPSFFESIPDQLLIVFINQKVGEVTLAVDK